MRVLVIEDDRKVGSFIQTGLEQEGYAVDLLNDGSEAGALEGYRTVTQNIYLAPGSTFKMRDTMDKLAAGEVSTPPPLPARPLRPGSLPPARTPNQG